MSQQTKQTKQTKQTQQTQQLKQPEPMRKAGKASARTVRPKEPRGGERRGKRGPQPFASVLQAVDCAGEAGDADRVRLGESEVRAAAEDFHRRRLEKGLVETDGQWFAQAIDEWMDSLACGEPRLSESALLHIAAGTRQTLAMRDAMLVSVLSSLTRPEMRLLASNPHDANSAKTVYDALNGVFRDPKTLPDPARCSAGLRLFSKVVAAVPRRDRAHPLACVAYVCWWLGFLDESRRCSNEALEIDPGCSLASIILTAAEFRVLPAWADCAVDETRAGGRP